VFDIADPEVKICIYSRTISYGPMDKLLHCPHTSTVLWPGNIGQFQITIKNSPKQSIVERA